MGIAGNTRSPDTTRLDQDTMLQSNRGDTRALTRGHSRKREWLLNVSLADLNGSSDTCQVDGSWAASDEWMGMGFVILEAEEEILQGQICTHRAQSPIHAEAEGIIWAMKEARARGLDDINFASDCQQLMNRDEVWPALTTELDEIKYLLSKFQSVVLTFLLRSCNIRADSLAKGGRSRAHCFAVVNSLVPFLPALEARHEEP
ncbi:hypothetical protein F2Q68_00025155 [Brassica cretica]|uniref:RNase H type-1 domain-containing protein n=1 Tax=Brassica cretica TaxID=69181 RepID=A0A8S9IEI0_BRACR|nr:hypothetical protein F2Q68_00025155 [Brassica cretica]